MNVRTPFSWANKVDFFINRQIVCEGSRKPIVVRGMFTSELWSKHLQELLVWGKGHFGSFTLQCFARLTMALNAFCTQHILYKPRELTSTPSIFFKVSEKKSLHLYKMDKSFITFVIVIWGGYHC